MDMDDEVKESQVDFGRYNQKQVNDIFANFIDSVWKIIPGKNKENTDVDISKDEVRICFQELMKIHGTIDAWDDKDFNELVNKFEDDEAPEGLVKTDSEIFFDKKEFMRLVQYVTNF